MENQQFGEIQRSLGQMEGRFESVEKAIAELRSEEDDRREWRSQMMLAMSELRSDLRREQETREHREEVSRSGVENRRSRVKTMLFSTSLTGLLDGAKVWWEHRGTR